MNGDLARQSDAQLLESIQQRQESAFAELARRYQSALVRVAASRLGRSDWAEEVVQETLFAAFKSRHTYDRRWSVRTWLWTILLNQCRAHFRRRNRDPAIEPWPVAGVARPSDALEGDSPLANLMARERRELLESLLAGLSPAQAEALRLRFFGELKFAEIAAAMDCSLGTAKNRVRWGLLRLADLMRPSKQMGEGRPSEALKTRTFDPADHAIPASESIMRQSQPQPSETSRFPTSPDGPRESVS